MLRRIAWIAGLALLVLVAYLLLWPVPIRPASWVAPAAPGYVGVHAANQRLAGLQIIELGAEEGPEHVAFGPDGMLYIGLGDGGAAGDPDGNGQRLGTLLGKIVRIDVNRACGGKPYCVPFDNPFVRRPGARPEIWVYGLRNPWRFSIDVDNSLWIGDVGQGLVEEINHIRPSQRGANLGWSCKEGTPIFDPDQCRSDVRYTDPVFEYEHFMTESCSVTGGVVYRVEPWIWNQIAPAESTLRQNGEKR